MGVFWDVAVKFFHCFYSCREAHIWTGISKSKCQGLSHFCTGVPCQLCHVLCSNLWALNLAQSLGYLSSSAPLYGACFLLVWLHFILVQRIGFTAHPRHQQQGNFSPSCLMRYLILFPCPCFHALSLSLRGEEGPCSNLWGSGLHGWREQRCSRAGSTTLYSCACAGIPSKALAQAPGKGWMFFPLSPCAHPHCSLQGNIPNHWRVTSLRLCLMWIHKQLSVYNVQ